MMDDIEALRRKRRKEEARQLKKRRIEAAGGVRPRAQQSPATTVVAPDSAPQPPKNRPGVTGPRNTSGRSNGPRSDSRLKPSSSSSSHNESRHRFGRVMERVPCPNKPRFSTLSIALPGSVVSNCQTRELKTHLVGQIARAATVYHVDEIVVFDDKLAKDEKGGDRGFYSSRQRRDRRNDDKDHSGDKVTKEQEAPHEQESTRSDPHTFMARVLQYCECPQYLRRHFFPMHPDLQFAGLLSPMDAPHHVRAEERSKYREGVVLDKKGQGPNAGSFVNCGIRSRPVEIDRVLAPGIRCTVQLDPKVYGNTARIRGTVVSPSAPREEDGTYWGYTTRLADSIHAVFDECPFEGGYDLKIGTSERGDVTVDDKKFALPSFQHTLIMFGGVAGIEECVDADETLKIPGSESRVLFDMWVNTCPFQASRTIRTEEAVLISLARLSPYVLAGSSGKALHEIEERKTSTAAPSLEFSDDAPSDESSNSD